MTTVPASIRYNNPGAMWGKGNPIASKWGAGQTQDLNDGLGQGNNIAIFPDMVHGAAAQFDLWHSSKNYHNKTLAAAIQTWSGGNSWKSYVAFLCQRVPGLKSSTVINDVFLNSPSGVAMMKAQAWNEAGRPYPMTDAQWIQAQSMVFEGVKTASTVDEAGNPLLVPGSQGEAVEELQKLLGCVVTGSYAKNSETYYALQLFQVRNGLSPDGKCGVLTWEKLRPAPTQGEVKT
jgi:hypothetical protein